MTNLMLSTPGVAIQELPFNTPTISGVATAIPVFIGPVTNTASSDGTPLIGNTWRITSLQEFETLFGVPVASGSEVLVIKRVDTNGALLGVDASFVTPPERIPTGERLLYHGMQFYFANGGGPCHIRPIAAEAGQTDYTNALTALESTDEITLNVILNTIGANPGNYGALVTASLQSCERTQDRFTIADVIGAYPDGDVDNTGTPSTLGTGSDDFRTNVNAVSEDVLKYGAAYLPYLNTNMPVLYEADSVTISAGSVKRVFDAEGSETSDSPMDLLSEAIPAGGLALSDTSFQGVVDPDDATNSTPGEKAVVQAVLSLLDSTTLILPPSPAIAGIYARVDRQRGVHVAPANVGVANAVGPALAITDDEQGLLNVDQTSGKSINAIRFFTGRGTVVWGARTFAGNSGDWKFINRRRAALYLEESIGDALESFVFEPNVVKTHVRVKRMIEGFLLNEWRAGTLTGPTAADAFEVLIGLGTTMTQQDIVDGIMRVLVRVAIPGPAEKIILQFTQKAQAA